MAFLNGVHHFVSLKEQEIFRIHEKDVQRAAHTCTSHLKLTNNPRGFQITVEKYVQHKTIISHTEIIVAFFTVNDA